jgi:hypothetical protein
MKLHALDRKILSNQRVEVGIPGEDVAPDQRRGTALELERAAKFIKHFECEKCDLPLVILLIIKKPVAPNPTTGHTLN